MIAVAAGAPPCAKKGCTNYGTKEYPDANAGVVHLVCPIHYQRLHELAALRDPARKF